MKLTQMTDTQLLDTFQTCPKEDEEKIKAEITRRINVKNNKPHPTDCICTDCTYQED